MGHNKKQAATSHFPSSESRRPNPEIPQSGTKSEARTSAHFGSRQAGLGFLSDLGFWPSFGLPVSAFGFQPATRALVQTLAALAFSALWATLTNSLNAAPSVAAM